MNRTHKSTTTLVAILLLLTAGRAGAPPIGRPAPRPSVRPIESYHPPYERPRIPGERPHDRTDPFDRPSYKEIFGSDRGKSFSDQRLGELRKAWGKERLDAYSKDEQVEISNLQVLCPSTFSLISALPQDMQQSVVREVVSPKNSELKVNVYTGINTNLDQVLRDVALKNRGFRPGRYYPRTATNVQLDSTLLQRSKAHLLSSYVSADLHEPMNALSIKEFAAAIAVTGKYPELQQSLVKLPQALRSSGLRRVASVAQGEKAKSVEEFVSEFNRLKVAFGDGDWKAAMDATAKQIDATVVALPEHPEPSRVPFVTARGGTLDFGELRVPRWEFLGIERSVVAKDFQRRTGNPDPDQPFLFLRGDHRFSTHSLLPGHLSARTFDGSGRFADIHIENFKELTSRELEPEKTVLFNLIPESKETIEQLGLAGGKRRWQHARERYDELADRTGMHRGDGTKREKLLDVLRKGELDTIVIVAHGEKDAIYLADGSKISVQDILDLGPLNSGRKPIVVLVSCETGRFDSSLRSIAQALLLQGRASAILAPTEKIPALGSTVRFVESLFGSGPRAASNAFKKINGPWQLYVELSEVEPWWLGIRSDSTCNAIRRPE